MPPPRLIHADGRVRFSLVEGRLRASPVRGSDVLARQAALERVSFRFVEVWPERVYDVVADGDYVRVDGCFHGQHEGGEAPGLHVFVGPVAGPDSIARAIREALSLPPTIHRVESAAALAAFECPLWVDVADTYRRAHFESSDFGGIKLRFPRCIRRPPFGPVRARGVFVPVRRPPGVPRRVGYSGSYLHVYELVG